MLAALREASARPVGRPYLERSLGLGEASARSLLRRLRSLGLLEPAGRQGHRATPRGERLAGILGLIGEAPLAGASGIPWRPAVLLATPALEPPRSLVDVYRVRDYLVEEGCREAVIAGYTRGSLELPGIPWGDRLAGEIRGAVEGLARSLGGPPAMLLLIVPARCRPQAYNAILKALIDRCRGSSS